MTPMMRNLAYAVGGDMRIVDSVVLEKGMVSWEQSGPLLHKLRFVNDPSDRAPRDAKGLVCFGTAQLFDSPQLV
jgi:hypothetical protein